MTRSAALALLAAILLPSYAFAQGALAGSTLDEIERPVAGLQVRAWAPAVASKGQSVAGESLSDEAGAWRIDGLETGRYQVQVRMPPGMGGNWADRWFDQADPFAGGWVGGDADWIEVVDGGVVEGVDIVMLIFGGLDGRVLTAGEPLAGVRVRAESLQDCRRNHVDETDTGADSDGYRLGRYSFRGLVPGETRLIAWHPSGDLQTAVLPLPFEVVPEQTPQVDDFELPPLPADPHEPNDLPADVGAGAPDAGAFVQVPPQPWRSSPGARIAPRGAGDKDWYCLYADDGDRFIATVTSTVARRDDDGGEDDVGANEEGCDEHPWIDPMVSIWRLRPDDAQPELVVADDDSGPGRRGARVDTGLLAQGGRVCALVSTYGDAGWDGVGRQSWGEYELELRMGNRHPTLDLFHHGELAPDVLRVAEGDAVCVDVLAGDPDGDAVTLATELADKGGQVLAEARFVPEAGAPPHAPAGRWCWTAGARAGDDSPYLLDVSARDEEFGAKGSIRIEVLSINQPPSVPMLLAPADGARLDQPGAVLVIENSVDADGDSLKYHFELHLGAVRGVPEHTASVPEADDAGGAVGVTSWQTPALPDEGQVCWRARADDGRPGGVSAWSEAWCFLIDSVNGPPATPVWNKPTQGQLVYVARPTLSVWAVQDPDGDPVEIEFARADDAQFEGGVRTGRVGQDPRWPTVAWRAVEELEWGRQYYGRARAHDDRGASSAWTAPQPFRLKPNRGPTPAALRSPELAAACDSTRLAGPLPDPLVLRAPYDPEGDAVILQVQILSAAGAATAVFDVRESIPWGGPPTVEVPTTDVLLEEGRRYILRIRTGDGEQFGAWSECDFWIDRATAAVTDLRISRPAAGERVPGPDRIEALLEHGGWPDGELPTRTLDATWRLCPTDGPGGEAATEACSDGGPVRFTGNEAGLSLGLLDLGYWRLQACARSTGDDECVSEAASDFVVVHASSPSSSCDCAIARGVPPGRSAPGPWWILALCGLAALSPGSRRRRTR